MSDAFFKKPILNSPYERPAKHWELDESGQPTTRIIKRRRKVEFVTPVPQPRRQRGTAQPVLPIGQGEGVSAAAQQYQQKSIINDVRNAVDTWRKIPSAGDWGVTPATALLLRHWRHHEFSGVRPFFCQIEAAEVAIWLTEVAPNLGDAGKRFLGHLEEANAAASPQLSRLALKLATGAGKTTVMAMLVAWQTINAIRNPDRKKFTKNFLVVTPGITIRDRLRVLQPNDPESYYRSRQLVPDSMLGDLQQAKIVITNYHAFKLRETLELSKTSRAFLQGDGPEIKTLETEGQMIQRALSGSTDMKNLMVLNDEAHHCYREKQGADVEARMDADEKKEAKKNKEAARLWISGLEAVQRNLGVLRVMDLSATPFFLRGSGYAEGTLFPWTMSDFSLMDAIECGIVKLPRVPVTDNAPHGKTPRYRNLWEYIGKAMPKQNTGKDLDSSNLPNDLISALKALYGHYEKTYEVWEEVGDDPFVPPCFVLVCNNMATSKLLYDYIAGYKKEKKDGSECFKNGHLELFRNFNDDGSKRDRPRTLLIDSERLESGEALDDAFRKAAKDEIERFRLDVLKRTNDSKLAANLSDQALLREAMNTVGRPGRLGGETRCVVSVSMLTEGWDANNVTHILGVRAFGTQLLCEQVVGRALRRRRYILNDQNHFDVEYADIFGIPFDFTAEPVVAPVIKMSGLLQVEALSPERDACRIQFPRVEGYRYRLPEEKLKPNFTAESHMLITPEDIGPSVTRNEGIAGEGADLKVEHHKDMRTASVAFELTQKILLSPAWRKNGAEPKMHLFGELKPIVQEWLESYVKCKGKTFLAQMLYPQKVAEASERIKSAVLPSKSSAEHNMEAILSPYNPIGSTEHVNFTTSKECYTTDARKCHVNKVVLDSRWEGELSRAAEANEHVLHYVKNQGLGFEVPYKSGTESRRYLPDFIVVVDDGRGADDPLHVVVEIKGLRGENAKDKRRTMDEFWVPGVNALGEYGRWAFAEFCDVYEIETELEKLIDEKREASAALHGKEQN